MKHSLVPGEPQAIVACIHHQRTVVTDARSIDAIQVMLNKLERMPKHAVFDCALYIAPVGALYFTYVSGDVLAVQLGGPCNTATNGAVTAFLGLSTPKIIRLSRSSA